MEIPLSDSETDKYYPQDDVSEYQRHEQLKGNADDSPAYDPNIFGDFDFDTLPPN
jgi:hypothetical protein